MAEKFFDLAMVTAECCSDEEYLRSAISRIYFATHLLAVQRVSRKRANFEVEGRAEDHGAVIRALNIGKTRRLADMLRSLRARRNHADYHVGNPVGGCPSCEVGMGIAGLDWTSCRDEAKRCFTALLTL
jgi:hypothetical protein